VKLVKLFVVLVNSSGTIVV